MATNTINKKLYNDLQISYSNLENKHFELIQKHNRLLKRNITNHIAYKNNIILQSNKYNALLQANNIETTILTNDLIKWEQVYNNIFTIITSIKKLSNNDTIKQLCNNLEYVNKPKSRLPAVEDDFDIDEFIQNENELDAEGIESNTNLLGSLVFNYEYIPNIYEMFEDSEDSDEEFDSYSETSGLELTDEDEDVEELELIVSEPAVVEVITPILTDNYTYGTEIYNIELEQFEIRETINYICNKIISEAVSQSALPCSIKYS